MCHGTEESVQGEGDVTYRSKNVTGKNMKCCFFDAGKTTLLRLVSGLEEPTSGRIFFDGAWPWLFDFAILCCSRSRTSSTF